MFCASRRRHTRWPRDWSSDVCSSDLGTIAVLLGIYDQFIGAINGIFSRDWKKHLSFLVPLAIGVAAAILTLGRIMDWLLKYYPSPTYYFKSQFIIRLSEIGRAHV